MDVCQFSQLSLAGDTGNQKECAHAKHCSQGQGTCLQTPHGPHRNYMYNCSNKHTSQTTPAMPKIATRGKALVCTCACHKSCSSLQRAAKGRAISTEIEILVTSLQMCWSQPVHKSRVTDNEAHVLLCIMKQWPGPIEWQQHAANCGHMCGLPCGIHSCRKLER